MNLFCPPASTANTGNKQPCYMLCAIHYFFRPESAVTLNNTHHFRNLASNRAKTNNDHSFRSASAVTVTNTHHFQKLFINCTTAKPPLFIKPVSSVLLAVGVSNCTTKYYSFCGITAVIVSYTGMYHFHKFGSNNSLRTINHFFRLLSSVINSTSSSVLVATQAGY